MICEIGKRHKVDELDYITQTREDGETYIYCTSHEPLRGKTLTRLKRWAE